VCKCVSVFAYVCACVRVRFIIQLCHVQSVSSIIHIHTCHNTHVNTHTHLTCAYATKHIGPTAAAERIARDIQGTRAVSNSSLDM